MADWDSAVRKPTQHRVNRENSNSPSGCQAWNRNTFVCILVLFISFIFMLIYLPDDRKCEKRYSHVTLSAVPYNRTYPLTKPVISEDGSSYTYRIALITDLDHATKVPDQKHTWRSYMRKGHLTVHNSNRISLDWDSKTINVVSTLSQGGRGMELSDLKVYNGDLLTIDDRTGVVYKIINDTAIVWVILNDGDGLETKGFKGEWMAVKDDVLYVGGLGKEWTTTTGEFVNFNPMFVKTVTQTGYVSHLNWTDRYIDMRAAAGIHYPGYMIHESAQWSNVHNKWFFLPRRASHETYTESADEKRATNMMIVCDADFKSCQTRKIGELSLTRGFSAFQFIPNTNDHLIVALKSEEIEGVIASYILVFDVDGKVYLPEIKLEGAFKFEGVEFI